MLVNEYIDVTPFDVIAASDRAEYARVAHSVRLHDAPNRLAMKSKSVRRLHAPLSGLRLETRGTALLHEPPPSNHLGC